MKVSRSLLASSRGNPLKIWRLLGIVEMRLRPRRATCRAIRASARASRSSTSRKSRGLGTLSVTASTIALPESLMVGHRIGDDEDAERGAADDEELERLKQHLEMAAERRVSAEDAADGDDQSDDEIQRALPSTVRLDRAARKLTPGCFREVSLMQGARADRRRRAGRRRGAPGRGSSRCRMVFTSPCRRRSRWNGDWRRSPTMSRT